MPVLPSWVDYLPDVLQAREVVDAAVANARADGSRLAALPMASAAEGLTRAAAEAARVSVLVDPGRSSSITWPYRDLLPRALAALATARRGPVVCAALSFANVLISHGGYVSGHYDASTREGLQREVRWLDELARDRSSLDAASARLLAYAALAAGRPDLSHALSDDPSLHLLGDAIGGAERQPFFDFVSAFPDAPDLGYGELLLVARAFVVHVEKRGPGGIGAAAAWLHRTVHQGPDPVVIPAAPPPPPPPPPPDPEVVARARLLFGAQPSPLSSPVWSTIVLQDVHPLFGGRSVSVSSRGDVWVAVVDAVKRTQRFHAGLSAAAMAEIDRLLREHDPRAIRTAERNPVAGEGRPCLTFTAAGATTVVGKYQHDRHPGFDALARWLHDTAAALAATAPSIDGADSGAAAGRG